MGETSFKFFLQFMGWTAIYCIFTLVLISIVISEVRHQVRHLSTFLWNFYVWLLRVFVSRPRIARLSANPAFHQHTVLNFHASPLFHQVNAYLVVLLLGNAI